MPLLPMAYEQILTAYKQELQGCGFAAETERQYLSHARGFFRYLEARGLSCDGAAVKSFLEGRKIGRKWPASLTSRLRAFCDFLVREEKLDSNPLGKLHANYSFERPNASQKKPVEGDGSLPDKAEEPGNMVVPLAPAKSRLELEEDWRIARLIREIEHLKSELRRLAQALVYKDSILGEHLNLWQFGLDHNVWPTIGEALKLLQKLRGAIGYDGPAWPEQAQIPRAKVVKLGRP